MEVRSGWYGVVFRLKVNAATRVHLTDFGHWTNNLTLGFNYKVILLQSCRFQFRFVGAFRPSFTEYWWPRWLSCVENWRFYTIIDFEYKNNGTCVKEEIILVRERLASITMKLVPGLLFLAGVVIAHPTGYPKPQNVSFSQLSNIFALWISINIFLVSRWHL